MVSCKISRMRWKVLLKWDVMNSLVANGFDGFEIEVVIEMQWSGSSVGEGSAC